MAPSIRNARAPQKVTAGVCIGCFIAGLPMVCNGGVYLFTLLDWHTASWAVLLLGMAEVSGIGYLFFYSFGFHFDEQFIAVRFVVGVIAFW